MAIPRIVTRLTNHKIPKYQFYFPGFNESNSCWLDGKWVDVTKEEFDANGAAHQTMWGDVRDLSKNQNHRDPGTPRDKMTPKQRKAWETRSGTTMREARRPDGFIGPVACDTAGGEISESSKRWLKKRGWVLV